MKRQIVIIFLFVANLVSARIYETWEKTDDDEHSLEWLFDMEEEDNEVGLKEPAKVCKTNECEILGKEFLRGINKSINPCDDFYDFVCGSFGSNYKIPGYFPTWSRPLMFQQTVFRRIKGLLETKPTKHDILPVRQAKKWYRACMDTDTLDKRGIKPLESILMQLGGWPMTIDYEEWDEDGHSWQRIEHHYFHLTGSYIFYEIGAHWRYGGYMESGDFPLQDELPLKVRNYTGNTFDDYMKLIQNVAQIFVKHNSASVTSKMIKNDVEDLIEFEKKLFEIAKVSSEYLDDGEETFDEFVERYENDIDTYVDEEVPKINFKKLFKSKFDMVNRDFNGSMPFGVNRYQYFINLTTLLNETPKRTIVNYLHWHFVSSMLVYTTEEMRNILFQYMEHEFGMKERKPRWLECMEDVKMDLAKSYTFVNKYFSKEAAGTARKMVDRIRDEMKTQISSSNWMNEETKDIAIEKLQDIKVRLGFPEWYKNKTIITRYYKGLNLGYYHFDNVLSYRKYQVKQETHMYLYKSTSIDMESVDPLIVNAFYQPWENIIELPAADFQPPLFTPQLPSVVNYGSVGCIIGHEIGHAYDVNGIKFGINGNRTKISKQVMEMYYKRAECFLDQFNNYYGVTEAEYEDTTPDYFEGSRGRKTRGENMADTTGLHSVVEAYKKVRTKNPDIVSSLPGFEDFTDDQMFFISFGALWCEIATPEFSKKQAEMDSHSPSRLRVIGAVSNSEDFAKAFKCPKGSSMNPDNKCNIWKSKKKTTSVKHEKKHHHPWVINW